MEKVQNKSPGLLLDSNVGNSALLLLCAICFLPVKGFLFFYIYDLFLLALLICVAPFIIFHSRRFFLTYEHLVFVALVLWTISVYVLSPAHKGFYVSWCMYLMPCILFYVLTQIMMKGAKQSFTNGILIIGLLISCQLIVSMIVLYFRVGGAYDLHMNANLYWAKSNYIAALLEMPLLWLYDRIENKSTRTRIIVVIFSLCFTALILTVSRGGILTIVLSMLLYNILKGKRLSKTFILLMGFSIIYISFTKSIIYRFLHMVDQGNISRVYLWLQSIELIAKEPILGYGAGNVILWANLFDTAPKMPGPHNIILEVMLHIGIGGFLICALLFFMLLRRAFAYYKIEGNPIYLVLIFASLAHSMVEPTFLGYQYGFIFWYFMSFLVLESNVLKRRLNE